MRIYEYYGSPFDRRTSFAALSFVILYTISHPGVIVFTLGFCVETEGLVHAAGFPGDALTTDRTSIASIFDGVSVRLFGAGIFLFLYMQPPYEVSCNL